MKLSEAQKLDAAGQLRRKVLTEQGWYAPKMREGVASVQKPDAPAVIRRRPGRPRKNEEI